MDMKRREIDLLTFLLRYLILPDTRETKKKHHKYNIIIIFVYD